MRQESGLTASPSVVSLCACRRPLECPELEARAAGLGQTVSAGHDGTSKGCGTVRVGRKRGVGRNKASGELLSVANISGRVPGRFANRVIGSGLGLGGRERLS